MATGSRKTHDLTSVVPDDIGPGLTQADLRQKRCADCGAKDGEHDHGGLELAQRCHVGAGFGVVYQDGVLYLFCRVCEEFVVHLAVASGANPGAH